MAFYYKLFLNSKLLKKGMTFERKMSLTTITRERGFSSLILPFADLLRNTYTKDSKEKKMKKK